MMASDRAIAQAFAEWKAKLDRGNYVIGLIEGTAAELDAATPPEGAAQGREDAEAELREIAAYCPMSHATRERLTRAIAALATQPTPAGGRT
jgi:organic hydroperoxide reductase OsmC/OhrA